MKSEMRSVISPALNSLPEGIKNVCQVLHFSILLYLTCFIGLNHFNIIKNNSRSFPALISNYTFSLP